MKYMSVKQATEYLGYKSSKSIYQLIELGLPVIHINKKTKLDKADIDKFMNSYKSKQVNN